MYALCLMYALVIIAVQSLRYVKRLTFGCQQRQPD